MAGLSGRTALVRRGIYLEAFTILWMVAEALISIGAGIVAGSLLLVAFGLDSVVELVSGSVLFWRLSVESRGGEVEDVERAERKAARLVGVLLALLCIYVLGTAAYGLVTSKVPGVSFLGVAISLAAVVVMPGLAFAKRRLAHEIDSHALSEDAASSMTCAYMAGAVLAGLVLNAAFGFWWAEDIASLAFLFWLIQETREAFEAATQAADDDDD